MSLKVVSHSEEITLTVEQLRDAMAPSRLTQRVTYKTTSDPTSVFYTAYMPDGTTPLQGRTQIANPPLAKRTGMALYYFDQLLPPGLTDFLVRWDEGDAAVYEPQWVTVDTRAGIQAGNITVIDAPSQSVPGTPTNVVAVAGDGQVTVTWDAPDPGDSPITNYVVLSTDETTAANGGQQAQPPATSTVMIGLTNGDTYTFTVAASNIYGTSLFSDPSNEVTPAQVAVPPGAPTNPSATPGDTTAEVSFTAPVSDGGASITRYDVTPHDTTAGTTGTVISGASSPVHVTGLTNNHTYYFTVVAHNSAGNGSQSVASNTVVPNPAAVGAGVATFAITGQIATALTLDASGSVGTLTWNVDGKDSTIHTATLTIGPLTVGTHTIKLTAVGTTTAVSTRTVDVAWIAKPIAKAQHDSCNDGDGSTPKPGTWNDNGDITKSTVILPAWSDVQALGPWRNKNIVNTAQDVPPGDGIPRIVAISPDECSILTKYGDWPQQSGGYRAALEFNKSYGQSVTYTTPFAVAAGLVDPCGNIPVDSSGNATAQTGQLRFHRIEIMFPDTNPGGANAPSGYSTGQPWLYQNNAYEIHGGSGSNSSVRFSVDGAGQNWEWVLYPLVAGSGKQYKFDTQKTLYNTWYLYAVEYLISLDPAVGYFRLWRDTGAGMAPVTTHVPAGTILTGADAGKFFPGSVTPGTFTAQVDNTGKPVYQSMELQNYRTRSGMPSTYPDVVIHYRNFASGPTLASVMG